MKKKEFLAKLKARLYKLPREERKERLGFYGEMIDDRMEEGLSEEDAVAGVGTIDEIVSQIMAEAPGRPVKEKIKPKGKIGAGIILLLILGSPLWLPLLLAAFSVILSLYAVVLSVIVSVWAVEISLLASSVGGVVVGIIVAVQGNVLTGFVTFGASIFCAGLSIFLFFVCKAVTKAAWSVTKKMVLGIKNLFIKKEKTK